MIWRNRWKAGLVGLLAVVAGCDYRPKKPAMTSADQYGPLPSQAGKATTRSVVEDPNSVRPTEEDPEIARRREVILASVMKLMETAYNHPGGRNFEFATENLNELFEHGTTPADYASTPDSRDFLSVKIAELTNQDPSNVVKALSSPKWTIRDARHIEDCMLYHAVATRIAGEGDDLTRVRRIFDWLVRNVQLVPARSLSAPGMTQAQARPADVLFRGMATEEGSWSERGWLFMSLCRQIGVDVGILTYSQLRPGAMMAQKNPNEGPPNLAWITAAVVDDKLYLFDQRIGMEVPSLDGKGVATLEEAIATPEILDRLDLPGQSSLGVTAAILAASPAKIGILVDSTVGYMTPRMRLLQGQLRGQSRTILFRDPAEQARHFVKALGAKRYGGIYLWNLPLQVEDLLFSNPNFVAATQASLQFFDNRYPLLFARTAHLRGDLVTAIDKYRALRFVEEPVGSDEKPIAPETQKALDIYASYFMAQIQLDQGNIRQAEDLFRQTVNLVPEPGPGRNFYYMLRWGALVNLARLAEARGDTPAAIAYYGASDFSNGMVTPQRHGDLFRARRLVWNDPTAASPAPLPPAPAPAGNEAAGPGSNASTTPSSGVPPFLAAPTNP